MLYRKGREQSNLFGNVNFEFNSLYSFTSFIKCTVVSIYACIPIHLYVLDNHYPVALILFFSVTEGKYTLLVDVYIHLLLSHDS